MDVFLEDGLEMIFRIGLALMEHSHDDLMSMDLEEMTKVHIILPLLFLFFLSTCPFFLNSHSIMRFFMLVHVAISERS